MQSATRYVTHVCRSSGGVTITGYSFVAQIVSPAITAGRAVVYLVDSVPVSHRDACLHGMPHHAGSLEGVQFACLLAATYSYLQV